MSVETLAETPVRTASPALWSTVAALALGFVAWGVLFHEEIEAALRVWLASTAYNHCFLILPIVAYLLWDRRGLLATSVPRPTPALALVILPVGFVWLLTERIGIMEGRQLAAMTIAEILLMAALGWPLWRQLSGPLLYLYFLVPFGAFVTPALQSFTASFVMHGLDVLGIANYTDGNTIEIPEGTFFVAEACAGLRFLVASVAFGCLYALMMYRSPLRRATFIAVSMVVPIIANGFRALGIVVLGHMLGSAEAAAADHVVYGWVFFSAVILMLALLGLPLREDWPAAAGRRDTNTLGPASAGPAFGAIVASIAAAAICPLLTLALDRASAAELPAAPPSLPVGLCAQASDPPPSANPPGLGLIAVQRLTCSGMVVLVQSEAFSPRVAPGAIIEEERRLTEMPPSADVETQGLSRNGLNWQVLSESEPDRTAAALIWIDDRSLTPSRTMRLRQAWRTIAGGPSHPVLVIVRPATDTSDFGAAGRRRSLLSIQAYLEDQPNLAAALARISSAPSR